MVIQGVPRHGRSRRRTGTRAGSHCFTGAPFHSTAECHAARGLYVTETTPLSDEDLRRYEARIQDAEWDALFHRCVNSPSAVMRVPRSCFPKVYRLIRNAPIKRSERLKEVRKEYHREHHLLHSQSRNLLHSCPVAMFTVALACHVDLLYQTTFVLQHIMLWLAMRLLQLLSTQQVTNLYLRHTSA